MPTAPLARTAAPSAAEPAALPWGGLLTLAATAFTAVLTELLPAGLLPRMSGGLGVSQGRVGFLVTLYAAASFLSAIPLTALLRGLPRRTVLTGALTGLALADAVTALSPSYLLTCGARLLAGAMGGTLWAMLAGYGARMVPARRRGRAIAIVLAGITVALSLGVPLGSALAGAVGWRAGFAALAVLAALLVLCALRYVPDFPGEPSAGRTPLRHIAALPGIRTVLSVTLLLLLGHQAMYTFLVAFAEHAGFGRADLVLFLFGAATVAGIWLAGALADRRPRATLLAALG
ncbi:MFS transporter, partial [Streptomyces sp. ERV7]|uniref:MFS transporter n=1 Tax=Streptomyces sp. ERV7 TaxID=1322334 RepID=UPI0007F40C36